MFTKLWAKFEKLVSEGRILSHKEVYKEVQDEEFDEWKKKNKEIFLIDREHFDLVKEILAKYPELDDESKEKAHADPFLVAMALQNLRKQKQQGASWRPMVIVTDEIKKRQSPKKIPFVAKEYGIECLTLMEFLEREDWGK